MVPVAVVVVRLLSLLLALLEVGVIVASHLGLESFAFGKIMRTSLVLIARIPRLHRSDVPFPLIPLFFRDVRPVIDFLHGQVLLLLLVGDHGRMRQALTRLKICSLLHHGNVAWLIQIECREGLRRRLDVLSGQDDDIFDTIASLDPSSAIASKRMDWLEQIMVLDHLFVQKF